MTANVIHVAYAHDREGVWRAAQRCASDRRQTRRAWNFLAIERVMTRREGREVERLTKLLRVAASSGFKIWRLWTPE